MLSEWRWDQGRLQYFLFDNIKAIAQSLTQLDGILLKQAGEDPLLPLLLDTGLTFKKPDSYRVWRNYKRVFECSLLATQVDNRLRVSDFCRRIADVNKIVDSDEYLSLHFPRFRYPFPAFESENESDIVYPFCAILKYLISRTYVSSTISVSPGEVASLLIGNGCTGLEELNFYRDLKPTSYVLSGDDARQVREMLIFMSQLSALKWYGGNLLLDVTSSDEISIDSLLQLAAPIYTVRKASRSEDFMAITALSNESYRPLIIPSRGVSSDELFAEGKRTRVTHIKIERSPLLRKFFLEKYPEPVCDMCDTHMRIRYPWTKHLIEVHHLLPLSSTLTVRPNGTSLDDVVGLCPNCHRSVHSFYKLWLDDGQVDDFRSHIEARAVYTKAKSSIVL